MKKLQTISVAIVATLCAAGVADVMAQLQLPQSQDLNAGGRYGGGDIAAQQRHFAFGVTLRESYDSNIITAEDAEGSFCTTVGPDLHFAWSSPTTDVAVHYVYFATYYSNRPGGSDWDQSHDFTFDVSHEFSPRFRVTLSDRFRPGFEPELDKGATQRLGDYIENSLDVGTVYSLGGRWELPVNFHHYFISYTDGPVSQVQDRQTFGGEVGVRYLLSAQTRLEARFNHEETIYEDVNRNTRSERLYGRVSHAFSPRLSVDADVGAAVNFFDGGGGMEVNPDIRLNVNYAMSPRTVLTGQFACRMLPTELVQYYQQQNYNFMFGVTHQFTSRLTMGANVLYAPTFYDYDIRTDSPGVPAAPRGTQHEDIISAGVNISYQFNMHWRAEVGATHTAVSSDFNGRTYDRTIGYVQTRIGF